MPMFFAQRHKEELSAARRLLSVAGPDGQLIADNGRFRLRVLRALCATMAISMFITHKT
jgi:hypothetical protein